MTEWQMARLDRLAYGRAMRATKNAKDGSAAIVYHTIRHRWIARYKVTACKDG